MKATVEIQLSKTKPYLGVVASICFVVLGVWVLTVPFEAVKFTDTFNPNLLKGVGGFTVLFFGATSIYWMKKLFDKKVGLSLNAQGITDNSSAASIGLIEWKDISSIRTQQIASTKFLFLDIQDPEKYIDKAPNIMIAKLMRANMRLYRTPITLSSNTLKIGFEALENIVRNGFEKNREAQKSTKKDVISNDLFETDNLLWQFHELLKTLIAMSMPFEGQRGFYGYGAIADEMLEDFYSFYTINKARLEKRELIDSETTVQLEEIDNLSNEWTSSKEEDFWFEMENYSSEWDILRRKAKKALKIMKKDHLTVKVIRKTKLDNNGGLLIESTNVQLIEK